MSSERSNCHIHSPVPSSFKPISTSLSLVSNTKQQPGQPAPHTLLSLSHFHLRRPDRSYTSVPPSRSCTINSPASSFVVRITFPLSMVFLSFPARPISFFFL
ncbi:hypothetical protein M407DRAFT_125179 [Tulasnella calospora MUT 4182]|uniref:Uncharacterized protein n=1 Tax=Tulasnella calospora MUT 4182 TaxID=1051891 RepID=A0A0C3QBA1_9AGAM|nr:hypothetical protein M407DRAFT_125179 [Tulasnella calospora MUT 4182]